MRVALCFSGHTRFLTQTHKYWKSVVLDRYSPDVFVHTWLDPRDLDRSRSDAQTLQDLYAPTVLAMELPRSFQGADDIYKERLWPYRITVQGQLSQFTGIKMAQVLRRNYETAQGFRYDISMRARFDWYLERLELEVNDSINVPDVPTLYNHRFTYRGQSHVGICDQFAFGRSELMDVYAGIVDNIPHLYHDCGVDFCGELFTKGHLLDKGIDVKQHLMGNGIVRTTGLI